MPTFLEHINRDLTVLMPINKKLNIFENFVSMCADVIRDSAQIFDGYNFEKEKPIKRR